jgi:hypothetical protein
MKSFETYPQRPQEIELSKIVWAFWQKSFMYDFCNQYVCLFECDTKAINENGTPIQTLGRMDFTYKAFGNFYLYKTFKMSNGGYGIDKGRPLKVISISSDTQGQGLDEFKQLGIYEVLNQYLLSLNVGS